MANTDLLGNSFNTLVPTHEGWMGLLSVIDYTNDIVSFDTWVTCSNPWEVSRSTSIFQFLLSKGIILQVCIYIWTLCTLFSKYFKTKQNKLRKIWGSPYSCSNYCICDSFSQIVSLQENQTSVNFSLNIPNPAGRLL